MFDFRRIVQDLVAKVLQVAGAAISATGVATSEETTAIVGGIAALVGVAINMFTNRNTRKEIAIVTEAVDDKKTTAAAINSAKPLVLPTDKKNLASA